MKIAGYVLAAALALAPSLVLADANPNMITNGVPDVSYETDRSGTVTIGGVAQTIAAPNPLRLGFEFQNQSPDDEWVSTKSVAAPNQPSERIPPGSYWRMPARFVGAISLYGSSTNDAYYAKEW